MSEYWDPWHEPEPDWDGFDPDALIWTTKEGEDIPIPKLATSHLKNCIALMRKKGWVPTKEWAIYHVGNPSELLARLEKELAKRPHGYNLFDKRQKL
jgi:hypothetical protein